jgi:hypothetical protein
MHCRFHPLAWIPTTGVFAVSFFCRLPYSPRPSFGFPFPLAHNRMESASPRKKLTREELRIRRCIAFGIENAVPIDTKPLVHPTSSAVGQEATKKRLSPEVIDLWDDSSDDDVKVIMNANKKTRAVESNETKKPPSLDAAQKKSSVSTRRRGTIETEHEKDSSTRQSRTFQVATWNVWFGPLGDGAPHAALRMRTIVRLLRESSPIDSPLWCIGFQEVVDETAKVLQPALQAANYQWFRQPGTAAYGCAMAIHSDLTVLRQGWVPYSVTVMQRGFLYAHVQLPIPEMHSNEKPVSLLFITTHLESYTGPQYTGAKQRPEQLLEIHSFVQEQQRSGNIAVAIVSGDMNWDDERVRSAGVDPPLLSTFPTAALWKDTWIECLASDVKKKLMQPTNNLQGDTYSTPKKEKKAKTASSGVVVGGYTYDAKLNPMLGGSLRRRFDRILVQDRSTSPVQIVSTQLLGTQAIEDWTWMKYNSYAETSRETPTAPSDHFGYQVTFQV